LAEEESYCVARGYGLRGANECEKCSVRNIVNIILYWHASTYVFKCSRDNNLRGRDLPVGGGAECGLVDPEVGPAACFSGSPQIPFANAAKSGGKMELIPAWNENVPAERDGSETIHDRAAYNDANPIGP
jgi:hypothetical protein